MRVTTDGTILEIFDKKTVGASNFELREFVVKVDEYNEVKLQMTKEKCEYLDKYKKGDKVEVTFFVNGKKYGDNWFTNLTCNFIKKAEGESTPAPVADTATDLPF